MLELVRDQARAWGVGLDPARLSKLEDYARLLAGYDEANVIGTRRFEDILLGHVLDSLSCYLCTPLKGADQVIDVGSGGGLPGIPVEIAGPRGQLALLEATAKKARFLRLAAKELELQGTVVLNERAEDAGRLPDHRGRYGVALTRAVARLSVVVEYCIPLLAVGGHAVSMKGRLQEEELAEGARAAEAIGARVREVIRVPFLPEVGEKERCLVLVEKERRTPSRYPRRVGMPAKRPLGVV